VSPLLHAIGYDTDRLYGSVTKILAMNALCAMATRTRAGAAHINTAFFCFNRELHLYFLSHPESVHSRNLSHLPQMAVAVFDSHQPWGAPHAGLQLFGTGSITSGDDARQASELYAARFPRFAELAAPASGPTSSGRRALRLYRFVPERALILDEWEFGEEVFITAIILPESEHDTSPE
jgi:uncharacterized protein YhbP (UPF0306 family)